MLANLDVLIGLSVIMLGLSLIVTIVGQVASNALAARKTNLKWGLSVLLQELHPERFTAKSEKLPLFGRNLDADAKNVVGQILAHPLVSDSGFRLGVWKMASVVRFDEFVKTIGLLSAASGGRNHTAKWLSENSKVTEPWFNSMMDRLTQRFTALMRVYTVVISALLVIVTGVDTSYILRTLRSDATVRSGLVAAADSIAKSGGADTPDVERVKKLASAVINQLPEDQSIWNLLRPASPSVLGRLLSIMLLSLGAPFWFNALKNLTALRPLLAKKEDQERSQAQKASTPDVGDGITWKDLQA